MQQATDTVKEELLLSFYDTYKVLVSSNGTFPNGLVLIIEYEGELIKHTAYHIAELTFDKWLMTGNGIRIMLNSDFSMEIEHPFITYNNIPQHELEIELLYVTGNCKYSVYKRLMAAVREENKTKQLKLESNITSQLKDWITSNNINNDKSGIQDNLILSTKVKTKPEINTNSNNNNNNMTNIYSTENLATRFVIPSFNDSVDKIMQEVNAIGKVDEFIDKNTYQNLHIVFPLSVISDILTVKRINSQSLPKIGENILHKNRQVFTNLKVTDHTSLNNSTGLTSVFSSNNIDTRSAETDGTYTRKFKRLDAENFHTIYDNKLNAEVVLNDKEKIALDYLNTSMSTALAYRVSNMCNNPTKRKNWSNSEEAEQLKQKETIEKWEKIGEKQFINAFKAFLDPIMAKKIKKYGSIAEADMEIENRKAENTKSISPILKTTVNSTFISPIQQQNDYFAELNQEEIERTEGIIKKDNNNNDAHNDKENSIKEEQISTIYSYYDDENLDYNEETKRSGKKNNEKNLSIINESSDDGSIISEGKKHRRYTEKKKGIKTESQTIIPGNIQSAYLQDDEEYEENDIEYSYSSESAQDLTKEMDALVRRQSNKDIGYSQEKLGGQKCNKSLKKFRMRRRKLELIEYADEMLERCGFNLNDGIRLVKINVNKINNMSAEDISELLMQKEKFVEISSDYSEDENDIYEDASDISSCDIVLEEVDDQKEESEEIDNINKKQKKKQFILVTKDTLNNLPNGSMFIPHLTNIHNNKNKTIPSNIKLNEYSPLLTLFASMLIIRNDNTLIIGSNSYLLRKKGKKINNNQRLLESIKEALEKCRTTIEDEGVIQMKKIIEESQDDGAAWNKIKLQLKKASIATRNVVSKYTDKVKTFTCADVPITLSGYNKKTANEESIKEYISLLKSSSELLSKYTTAPKFDSIEIFD